MTALASPRSTDVFDPLPDTAPFCRVIPGFLSVDECRVLIAESEVRGFRSAATDYPPSYRTNDRQVLDDVALADRLLARLRGWVPDVLAGDDDHRSWRLDAINSRLRLCRYRPGQAFGIHQDGVHHRSADHRSQLTFMVYLTDADAFQGGDTVFHDAGFGVHAREIGRVRPRAGSLIVFDHRLWHAGAPVRVGVKHVLRSDVLYRRDPAPREATGDFDSAHRGYIWTLESLGEGRFASGGRDAQIHLWDRDGRRVGTLAGHDRSVLGLAALRHGRLASVSRDRSMRLWTLADVRCSHVVDDAHGATMLSVVALTDGSLATSGADGQVKLWSEAGESRGALESTNTWIWSLVNLPGGQIAGASEDGAVRIWNLESGRCIETLAGNAPLRTLAASSDGRWLVSGNVAGSIEIRAASNGSWRVVRVQQAHAAAVRRVRLLDDDTVASVGEDGEVRLSSLSGTASRLAGSHANFATDVARIGGELFSCGYDGRIRRLDDPAMRGIHA
jgi:hypothetical protein